MRLESGDYVAIAVGNKKHLGKVTKKKKSGYKVTIDGSHLSNPADAESMTVDAGDEDILSNFGPNPEPGISYGIQVEPYYRTVTRKPWGQVHFFRDVKDNDWKALRKGLDKVATVLDEYQLKYEMPIEIEVKPPKGKYAGAYKYKSNGTDTMYLRPHEFIETPYTVAHETGHYIWFRTLDQELKAKWIKLYHKSVAISKIKPKELEKILGEFSSSGQYVKQYRKELEERDQLVFDEIVKWIRDTHHLDKKHIDMLVDAGEDLEPYWPKTELDLSEMQIVISDYANKNPEEFFAEAFAFWLAKYDLPSRVNKLVKKSLLSGGGFEDKENEGDEGEKVGKKKKISKKNTNVKSKKKPKEEYDEDEDDEDDAVKRRRKRREKIKKAA